MNKMREDKLVTSSWGTNKFVSYIWFSGQKSFSTTSSLVSGEKTLWPPAIWARSGAKPHGIANIGEDYSVLRTPTIFQIEIFVFPYNIVTRCWGQKCHAMKSHVHFARKSGWTSELVHTDLCAKITRREAPCGFWPRHHLNVSMSTIVENSIFIN